ncbi:MAG: diacylglycerol kinase family protein [Gemmatimonadota bacterium]
MRTTLVHNPTAGHHTPSRDDLLRMLRREGHDPSYCSSKDREFAAALEDPGELVIVAGGDGTVGKVACRLAGRGIPLAILPLGTANNFAQSLGIAGAAETLAASWKAAAPRPVDVGVARGPWGETVFLEGVGLGLFPRLLAAHERRAGEAEEPGTDAAKLRQGLRLWAEQLAGGAPLEVGITLDGEDLSGRYVLAEALNVGLVGPNLPLAPDADPGDGRLDLVLVGGNDGELARHLDDRLHDRRTCRPPELTVRRGSRLRLEWTGTRLRLDDELWPPAGREVPSGAWAELEVRAGALAVLAPAADDRAGLTGVRPG